APPARSAARRRCVNNSSLHASEGTDASWQTLRQPRHMDDRRIQHGYGHDVRSRLHDEGAFAYHLRRYRQQYGTSGISQRGLAMIAHVSRHFVEGLEVSPKLQGSVEPLLRVAIALERPIEELIAPARYRALREDIEGRRNAL